MKKQLAKWLRALADKLDPFSAKGGGGGGPKEPV